MTRILSISTAGILKEQLADTQHHCYPRVDYLELQKLLNAEVIDYSAYDQNPAGKYFRQLETQLRSDIYLSMISWWRSRQFPAAFTWSERAGIPFAALKQFFRSKTRFISMFQCWSPRQELVVTRLKLLSMMDDIIVHCTSMKENLVKLGAPEARIKVIHYSIDQTFYSPRPGAEQRRSLIVSVGEPRSRNYPSLFQAVDGLPVNLELPAYGHWYAREKSNRIIARPPANVSLIKRLSHMELRDFYARSQFVILPIRDLVYSAGATVTLEASSMARPVIAFRSRGITDFIIHGETGLLVEPGNTQELREAIQYLLANPQEVKRLGENARQRVVEELNFETYVRKIAGVLLQTGVS